MNRTLILVYGPVSCVLRGLFDVDSFHLDPELAKGRLETRNPVTASKVIGVERGSHEGRAISYLMFSQKWCTTSTGTPWPIAHEFTNNNEISSYMLIAWETCRSMRR